jgi:hypothetical protein
MSGERIRELNDQFRVTNIGGRVMLTAGVAALSEDTRREVFKRVRTPENDPHEEHYFGSFEVAGKKVFWKIDYFDAAMEFGLEDPADLSKTTRVLTIMLASEY